MAAAPSTAIYPSLRGKTVLLSGGAEGIGAATVKVFSLQGSQVIFLDIADDSAKKTINEIVSLSADAEKERGYAIKPPIFYHCDLSDLAQVKTTTDEIIQKHGPIHVLVNNAAGTGNNARVPTEEATPEIWDYNINHNLRHVFFLTQAILPGMKAQNSGSIINLGSICWRISAHDLPMYGTCKAAIMGMTRIQSKEVGRGYNIRINSVMPGAIATQRQKEQVLTDEYRAEVMSNQALQRDLEPEDVAKVIVFLGSDEASGITGSSYVVDGGWTSDP